MNKQTLAALKQSMHRTYLNHSKLVSNRKDEEYKLRQAAYDLIERQLAAKHDIGIEVAAKVAQIAKDGYEAAAVELGQSGEGAPYPLGTTLCEWDIPRGFSINRAGPRLTGKKGILEVFKRGDDYIGGSYRSPEPGDFVVRTLKKDGGRGKACVSADGYDFINWWRPEGVTLVR